MRASKLPSSNAAASMEPSCDHDKQLASPWSPPRESLPMGCRKPDIIEWEMGDRWEEKGFLRDSKAEVREEEEDGTAAAPRAHCHHHAATCASHTTDDNANNSVFLQ